MKHHLNKFIKTLKEKGLTLSLAESITCGLAAQKLSSCVGVSDVFVCSMVCYTPEAKMKLLQVKKSSIEKYTCESAEVTHEMAENLQKLIRTDIYAAITGLASADGSETKEKPVGTVFYCFIYKGKVYQFKKVFRGTPLEIKTKAAVGMYELILAEI